MIGADVDKYITRFHELARLVPRTVTSESKRIDRYIRGLASASRRTMEISRVRSFSIAAKEAQQDLNVMMKINKIVRGCGLELECHTFIIDSISFGHGSFDVNVGMDWLSKLRAKIVCFEKIVQIQLSNGEILEVHGEGPEGNLKQLKTMKVNEPKLKDIPVICKFPGVFSEDLLGLPPSGEVKFRIDLVPGSMPVAKSPYRLAPTEMQELSNQLKELQDKDPSKFEAVKNWKPSKTPTEIHLLLGLTRYYRRFITNFVKIAKPLTLLTQNNKKFEWGDEKENAFQTLKDMLCDAPILTLPEGTNDCVPYCDASNQGKANVARILEAQSEASKGVNTPAEMLKGLNKQFERKEDDRLYFVERIWVPSYGSLRTLIMNEAHSTKYFVHPGADKMYYDLRDLYWWPRMKKGYRFPEIPEWKWENITMDFITRLLRTNNGHDAIWVIVDRLTKSAHFLAIHEDYKWKGTRPDMSTAYHPQTDGQSERTMKTLEDMHRACAIDFEGNWDTHLIIAWKEVSNAHNLGRSRKKSKLIGLEIIQETTDKIVQIKEGLKTARDRQKSYVDNRQSR
ncbi:putative reverse transcriptase domain-containing protein [Tanacetum coccineum]